MDATERDQLAQETAEYIAEHLSTPHGAVGDDDRPTDVEGIKEVLLAGDLWISWLDNRVDAAMIAMHQPASGSEQPTLTTLAAITADRDAQAASPEVLDRAGLTTTEVLSELVRLASQIDEPRVVGWTTAPEHGTCPRCGESVDEGDGMAQLEDGSTCCAYCIEPDAEAGQ